MKKAAFVELYDWHTECIYSHLAYLKASGYHVEFICNDRQRERVGLISELADRTMFVDAGDIREVLRCRDYVMGGGFDKVILGTVYNDKAIKAFVSGQMHKKTSLFGVMHDLRHLRPSQRLMGRAVPGNIRNFFVLGRYIADNFPARRGNCCYIPLMFQPDYPEEKVEKDKGEIWIVVPGMVTQGRRDYRALLPADGRTYDKKVKIILLGYGGTADAVKLRQELKMRGVEDNIVFFDNYVDEPEFYSWIRKADYIMPLLHEECTRFDRYLKKKITGNLNIALNFRKPMLCDEAFSTVADYVPHSIFYKRGDLVDTVNGLRCPDVEKFYDAEFERTHTLEVLAKEYDGFLNR